MTGLPGATLTLTGLSHILAVWMKEADQTAKDMVKKARQNIASEKEQSIKEMKSEIGELIALAVGKIEEEKVSPESDKKLIDKFLADMDREEK